MEVDKSAGQRSKLVHEIILPTIACGPLRAQQKDLDYVKTRYNDVTVTVSMPSHESDDYRVSIEPAFLQYKDLGAIQEIVETSIAALDFVGGNEYYYKMLA